MELTRSRTGLLAGMSLLAVVFTKLTFKLCSVILHFHFWLFLFLSLHFLDELRNALSDFVPDRRKKILTTYLLMIVVLAFSFPILRR